MDESQVSNTGSGMPLDTTNTHSAKDTLKFFFYGQAVECLKGIHAEVQNQRAQLQQNKQQNKKNDRDTHQQSKLQSKFANLNFEHPLLQKLSKKNTKNTVSQSFFSKSTMQKQDELYNPMAVKDRQNFDIFSYKPGKSKNLLWRQVAVEQIFSKNTKVNDLSTQALDDQIQQSVLTTQNKSFRSQNTCTQSYYIKCTNLDTNQTPNQLSQTFQKLRTNEGGIGSSSNQLNEITEIQSSETSDDQNRQFSRQSSPITTQNVRGEAERLGRLISTESYIVRTENKDTGECSVYSVQIQTMSMEWKQGDEERDNEASWLSQQPLESKHLVKEEEKDGDESGDGEARNNEEVMEIISRVVTGEQQVQNENGDSSYEELQWTLSWPDMPHFSLNSIVMTQNLVATKQGYLLSQQVVFDNRGSAMQQWQQDYLKIRDEMFFHMGENTEFEEFEKDSQGDDQDSDDDEHDTFDIESQGDVNQKCISNLMRSNSSINEQKMQHIKNLLRRCGERAKNNGVSRLESCKEDDLDKKINSINAADDSFKEQSIQISHANNIQQLNEEILDVQKDVKPIKKPLIKHLSGSHLRNRHQQAEMFKKLEPYAVQGDQFVKGEEEQSQDALQLLLNKTFAKVNGATGNAAKPPSKVISGSTLNTSKYKDSFNSSNTVAKEIRNQIMTTKMGRIPLLQREGSSIVCPDLPVYKQDRESSRNTPTSKPRRLIEGSPQKYVDSEITQSEQSNIQNSKINNMWSCQSTVQVLDLDSTESSTSYAPTSYNSKQTGQQQSVTEQQSQQFDEVNSSKQQSYSYRMGDPILKLKQLRLMRNFNNPSYASDSHNEPVLLKPPTQNMPSSSMQNNTPVPHMPYHTETRGTSTLEKGKSTYERSKSMSPGGSREYSRGISPCLANPPMEGYRKQTSEPSSSQPGSSSHNNSQSYLNTNDKNILRHYRTEEIEERDYFNSNQNPGDIFKKIHDLNNRISKQNSKLDSAALEVMMATSQSQSQSQSQSSNFTRQVDDLETSDSKFYGGVRSRLRARIDETSDSFFSMRNKAAQGKFFKYEQELQDSEVIKTLNSNVSAYQNEFVLDQQLPKGYDTIRCNAYFDVTQSKKSMDEELLKFDSKQSDTLKTYLELLQSNLS